MTDIVERLRREAELQCSVWENHGDERIAELVNDAADEIERLRRERMAIDEAMRQERHHGSIRNERHHRGADADLE